MDHIASPPPPVLRLNGKDNVLISTRIVEKPEIKDTAWDSGKPHDWTQVDR